MRLRNQSVTTKMGTVQAALFCLVFLFRPQLTSAQSQPFFAPPQPSGSIIVALYPMENVSPGVSTLVTFGVPFTRGSLTVADLARVRVLKNGTEIPAFVGPQTPWRHLTDPSLDGQSVRIARIQIHYTFSVSYPNHEQIVIEWGMANRTRNVTTLENPRHAWHRVTSGSFVAADRVFEPDVYAVLPKGYLANGVVRPTRMNPLDDSVPEAREDPAMMDAIEHWPGYLEKDHAIKNNFYSVINKDDPRVTAANQNHYKTDFEPWLYDRASTMFVLYLQSGYLTPLREAVRATQFYTSQLYTGSQQPSRAIGLFKLKVPDPNDFAGGNGAMYSYNECLAYNYWLTGDDDVLLYIDWVVTAHETNDEPTRWSPTLSEWTERHTAFRLLANVIGYEVTGNAAYKNNVLAQAGDFIWHQNGAGGQVAATIISTGGDPANLVDGGLYHLGSQHGDGVQSAMVASSWMTALMAEAMIRAYALTEDANIANFVKRVGHFEQAATKTDADHLYDGYDGSLAYPDYMIRYDGVSDPLDGRLSDMVEHALDVGTAVLWAEYFNQLLGNPPSPEMKQLGSNLYFTYDIGVNHWIRPGGPTVGLTAFRVSPWRKWGWEHRTTASFSWLAEQLGLAANLPPTVSISSPASGASFTAPASITITANATDADGSITKVEFFQGAGKLGEATTSPYVFTWSNVGAGVYTLTAKATDNSGNTTISAAVTVTVSATGCAFSTVSNIYNQTFTAQSGTFTVIVDATPMAVGGTLEDTGVGVNQNPPVGESNSFQTAATVRFNTANNRIEARSGSNYPATNIPWSAGNTYRIRLVVNVAAHTYDAYVTALPGSAERTIGVGLAFRSNYASASSLNNFRAPVDAGAIQICNLVVPGGTPPSASNASAASHAGTALARESIVAAFGSGLAPDKSRTQRLSPRISACLHESRATGSASQDDWPGMEPSQSR